MEHWPGRVIDGRYVVEAVLGQGGMGIVLRARHQFTDAIVAIKMLHRDLMVHADVQTRFLAEAKTPSAIGHPGIVQVLDAGKTPDGELYLVMELLSGRTLRQAMYPSPPPLQVSRRIVLELLDALAAAHARGIIHRDLKPDNVFLVGPQATVKLLDFGIAKVIENATRAGGMTAAGAVLGTLHYMAPEQLSDASAVDLRTDLWAVGVMLYELISGRLPYRPRTVAEMMTLLISHDPDPIASHTSVSPAVQGFFARALARDRGQRFHSAQELAAALAALPFDSGIPAPEMRGPTSPIDTVGTMMTRDQPSPSVPHAVAAIADDRMRRPTPAPPMSAPHIPPPQHDARMRPPTPAPPIGAPHAPPMGAPYSQAPHAPPPIGAPYSHAPPPLQHAQPPAQDPRMRSPQTKIGLWIAGGVVAFVLVAVFAYLLARPGAPAPSDAAAPIAPREVVAVDADVWTTGPVDCKAACQRVAGCGFAEMSCRMSCVADVVPMRRCLANTECLAFSTCLLATGCEHGPSGSSSCAEAAACEIECIQNRGGLACACGCAQRMHAEHTQTLARLNYCVVANCQNQDLDTCVAANCAAEVASCAGTEATP